MAFKNCITTVHDCGHNCRQATYLPFSFFLAFLFYSVFLMVFEPLSGSLAFASSSSGCSHLSVSCLFLCVSSTFLLQKLFSSYSLSPSFWLLIWLLALFLLTSACCSCGFIRFCRGSSCRVRLF